MNVQSDRELEKLSVLSPVRYHNPVSMANLLNFY